MARTLLARMAKPEDIAGGDAVPGAGAAYVTGETLVVDGGML